MNRDDCESSHPDFFFRISFSKNSLNEENDYFCGSGCPSGEIGRRTVFRWRRRKVCWFESSLGHIVREITEVISFFHSNKTGREVYADKLSSSSASSVKCNHLCLKINRLISNQLFFFYFLAISRNYKLLFIIIALFHLRHLKRPHLCLPKC